MENCWLGKLAIVLAGGLRYNARHMQSPPQLLRGILQVALAAGLWGAAYPLTKGALATVPPILLGTLRFGLASLLLMAFTRSFPLRGIPTEHRRTVVKMAFWGTFVLVLGMNYGLRWAPAVAASIISGTPPLFTVVFAALWLNEPFRRHHAMALVLAIPGLVLLAGGTQGGEASSLAWAGIALTVLPQIAWAMYGVIGKSLITRFPWPILCRDTFSLGTLMLIPPTIIECWFSGFGTWTLGTLGVLLYLGIANSVITYGLWNSALAMIPVSTASFVLYLQPISGAVFSWVLFGETLGPTGILGAGLIFLALGIILRPVPDNG